ncbi:hypothetical protein KIN20_016135 [Parelaphostrongylus tenuis]|uniref:Uncharacterized protein n=1 Tax=Parelaphostrongylus tenuis TaxID=148309 RepID=A0AAD5MJJ8_PARTN|nr:hypothetical protein KIN20_016135 [Parelaphostrongylus tenuis]
MMGESTVFCVTKLAQLSHIITGSDCPATTTLPPPPSPSSPHRHLLRHRHRHRDGG